MFIIYFINIGDNEVKESDVSKNDQIYFANNKVIKNILINDGFNKIVSIEDRQDKDLKIELIDKNNNKIILKNFKPQWTKPVQVIDSYIFKTDKDKYFVFVINSYQKISGNEEWYDDIYIFNSKGKQVYGLEDELYKINDFKNKKDVLKILNKLKQEGKL